MQRVRRFTSSCLYGYLILKQQLPTCFRIVSMKVTPLFEPTTPLLQSIEIRFSLPTVPLRPQLSNLDFDNLVLIFVKLNVYVLPCTFLPNFNLVNLQHCICIFNQSGKLCGSLSDGLGTSQLIWIDCI